MIQNFALCAGLVLIIFSVCRVVRQNQERRDVMKARLYEIALAGCKGVSLHLIDRYMAALKQNGVDSPQVQNLRRFNEHDQEFINFCDAVDSIERML